jgi:ABC-type Na+ efflux pump permease subunit
MFVVFDVLIPIIVWQPGDDGCTEESTNRIAEVVVSSVKPFQLMLGKIIGIGMVALTHLI